MSLLSILRLPIHHTFAPHVDFKYLLKTIKLLVRPKYWQKNTAVKELENALSKRFNGITYTFATGRQALLAFCNSVKKTPGEQYLVQGYTCVVVPNAIHASGGTTVYCDINKDTLNLNCTKLEEKISSRTRAIICQHTFGIPADVKQIRQICDKHNLIMIEDLAHSLPDETHPSEIGKYGDVLLLSFGRDKAISGITGGAVIVKNQELLLGMEVQAKHKKPLPKPQILRYLLYPLIYYCSRPLYGIGLGKVILALSRKFGILPAIVTAAEKHGSMSPLLYDLPNPCAQLALMQFKKLEAINEHRRKMLDFYMSELCHGERSRTMTQSSLDYARDDNFALPKAAKPGLPLQKFPLFTERPEQIRNKLKWQNIHLQDGWSGAVINPPAVNRRDCNYKNGDCPVAEVVAKTILSLPTHPTCTPGQAHRVLKTIKLN